MNDKRNALSFMRRWRKLGLDEEEYSEVRGDYDEAFLHKDVRRGIKASEVRCGWSTIDRSSCPLSSKLILPRAHGSSLFTRGVTSGCEYCNLAPLSYSVIDTMEITDCERSLYASLRCAGLYSW